MRRLDAILMPLIEWICVAAIPTHMCLRIVGLSGPIPSGRVASASESHTSSYQDRCWELQSMAFLLLVTSIMTLTTILLFRDDGLDAECSTNRHESGSKKASNGSTKTTSIGRNERKSDRGTLTLSVNNKRGTGIIMGSLLMPILYMSINLFNFNESSKSAHPSSSLYSHLKLSVYGGLAFAASNFLCKWQGTKFNSYRLKIHGRSMPETNGSIYRTNGFSKQHQPHTMQLTASIYLVMLALDFLSSHQYTSILPSIVTSLLHVNFIASYQQKDSLDKSWQNAFTQGEWMVVSNFLASLLGEFFVQNILQIREIELSEHIIVAHAGMSGCIMGIVVVAFLQRTTHQFTGQQFTLVAMVVATTIGCLEVAMDAVPLSKSVLIGVSAPRSLQWLLNFLSVDSRMVILLYWLTVLAVCLQISIRLAEWTVSPGAAHSNQKRCVVIARKFFHLVAILIFAPITWMDRDMMCLSYAIAVALMLVVELVRSSSGTDGKHNSTNNLNRSSRISSLNQFYMVFFDEKDSSGGIVVSHITLIIGCAFPLWVHQLLIYQFEPNDDNINQQLLRSLPYVGIVVLGIGDSAGAVGGLSFPNPTRWPGGSSRTLEGSICMFLFMLCAAVFLAFMAGLEIEQSTKLSFMPLLAMTMIEASTKQIDNLCLPVAASTLIVLSACLQK